MHPNQIGAGVQIVRRQPLVIIASEAILPGRGIPGAGQLEGQQRPDLARQPAHFSLISRKMPPHPHA